MRSVHASWVPPHDSRRSSGGMLLQVVRAVMRGTLPFRLVRGDETARTPHYLLEAANCGRYDRADCKTRHHGRIVCSAVKSFVLPALFSCRVIYDFPGPCVLVLIVSHRPLFGANGRSGV